MHNRENNPLALGFLDTSKWMQIDGTDIDAVHAAAEFSIADIRNGRGPRFVWATVPRMCSHSCADDHRQYLPKEELTALQENDPLRLYRQRLTGDGIVAEAELESMETSLKEEIRETYAQAAKATDPNPAEAELHLLGHPVEPEILSVPLQNKPKKMVETVNRLFHAAVETNPDFIFFGEDVEDPKGGVFKLTEGLSTKYPSNAFNSPVAESTILGVSCGLASYGKRPIADSIHRLYRTRLEPTSLEYSNTSLAHIWRLVLPYGYLCPERCLLTGWWSLAQSIERRRLCSSTWSSSSGSLYT